MSICKFILKTVKSLIISVENEIKIMDEQLNVLVLAPGITKKDQIQLSLQRNIKSALHDLLVHYYNTLKQTMPKVAPLQQVISCHIYTLQQDNFQILLHELYGQQSALTTLVGEEYKKCTNDADLPADIHLQMIFLVFPWEFIIDLLSNSSFLKTLLKTVLNYDPSKHVKAVSTIFNSIQKFQTLPLLASKIRFFTAQAPMYFALAELLVTLFTHKVMIKENWNPLVNFSIAEKCALIAQRGIQICELNSGLMKVLHDASLKKSKENQSTDDFAYLRPIESFQHKSSESEDDIDDMELPELRHVVLELRKIEIQHSPSLMLFCLSNALQWLTAALTVDGRQIGADESFQFFAFCLSHAKISCLPSIVAYIDKFVDDALHETKYEYYIEHLRSGFGFIDNRLLPVQPFLVFPFAKPPPHLRGILKRVESSNDEQANTNVINEENNNDNSNNENNSKNDVQIENNENNDLNSNSNEKKKEREPIIMKGFDIYAFPTWRNEYNTLFPAMIKYTGELNSAICYQYTVSSITALNAFNEAFEAIPTLYGTFFQLKDELVQSAYMIKIENEDYEKEEDRVEVYSSLMLMATEKFSPKLSNLDQLFASVKAEWHFRSNDSTIAVKTAVAEVQKALVLLSFLPDSFPIDGVFNFETMSAIREFIKDRKLIITPQLFKAIVSSAK
ncbi:hypothetical protein M9Y10_043772 [Tritrichomonas musculus]|uniref:VPS9 domain-containing protein n=1 Tax=Tritrichomonas musculus TaxID=1915356 RepID=A0ABR2K0L9_9EUKA